MGKKAQIISVQLNGISHTEHICVMSIQFKRQSMGVPSGVHPSPIHHNSPQSWLLTRQIRFSLSSNEQWGSD